MAFFQIERYTSATAGHKHRNPDVSEIGDMSSKLEAESFSPVTTVVPEFVTLVVWRRALSLEAKLRQSTQPSNIIHAKDDLQSLHW